MGQIPEVDLPITRREDIIGKIMSRVVICPISNCWIWQGPDSGEGRGGGYGRVSISGVTSAVHLVVYTHFFGYIPGRKQVDHKCNNRLCCNPLHLELVTHKQNQKRRASRAKESSDGASAKKR